MKWKRVKHTHPQASTGTITSCTSYITTQAYIQQRGSRTGGIPEKEETQIKCSGNSHTKCQKQKQNSDYHDLELGQGYQNIQKQKS